MPGGKTDELLLPKRLRHGLGEGRATVGGVGLFERRRESADAGRPQEWADVGIGRSVIEDSEPRGRRLRPGTRRDVGDDRQRFLGQLGRSIGKSGSSAGGYRRCRDGLFLRVVAERATGSLDATARDPGDACDRRRGSHPRDVEDLRPLLDRRDRVRGSIDSGVQRRGCGEGCEAGFRVGRRRPSSASFIGHRRTRRVRIDVRTPAAGARFRRRGCLVGHATSGFGGLGRRGV